MSSFYHGKSENTFTAIKVWEHATGNKGTLAVHARSVTHTDAMKVWHEFKVNKENHTTIRILQSANKCS